MSTNTQKEEKIVFLTVSHDAASTVAGPSSEDRAISAVDDGKVSSSNATQSYRVSEGTESDQPDLGDKFSRLVTIESSRSSNHEPVAGQDSTAKTVVEASTQTEGWETSEEESEENSEEESDETTVDWESKVLSLPLLSTVGEFDFESFKNRWGVDDRYHVIELLMGSDGLAEQADREKVNREEHNDKRRHKMEHKPRTSENNWIQRVRIHSPIILRYLRNATRAPEWDTESPRVFFRPFKALIYYHEQMRKALETLEKDLKVADGPSDENETKTVTVRVTDSGALPEEEQSETTDTNRTTQIEIAEGAQILEHLRCYVDFVDSRLLPRVDMFNGTATQTVQFADLWFLFQLGDTLYAPPNISTEAKRDQAVGNRGRYQTCFKLYFKAVAYVSDLEPDDLKPNKDFINFWCCYMDFDGQAWGSVKEIFTIEYYSGHKDIRSLPVYPLRFAPNAEKLRAELTIQGKLFRKFAAEKHVFCDGWTMTGQPLGTTEKDELENPEHVESDVIIDLVEAMKRNPAWKPEFMNPTDRNMDTSTTENWTRGTDNTNIYHWPGPEQPGNNNRPWFRITEVTQRDDDSGLKLEIDASRTDAFLNAYVEGALDSLDGLDENEYNLLLPRRFYVYILRQRRFAMVDISSLSLIPPQSTIFNDLRIDENHKLILQSLVEDHFGKRKVLRQRSNVASTNQDIVRGKGSGLFILLHGVPGVGKTATAEAIAQANNKPLFAITCGDLGLTPEAVDSKLNEVFRLAHLWDCVLLLDEADIFLSRRDTFNLTRNALVSVFLRVLEYYSGILFLTTNRVGILDEAFKSRIHISLYYEPLSQQQTVEIFRVNIKRLRQMEDEKEQRLKDTELKQPRLRIMAKRIIDYATQYFDDQEKSPHLRWNGRQIRNAFQIASSLAHYDMRTSQLRGGDISSSHVYEPVLDENHFKTVSEAIEKFGNYLDRTRAMTDADQARLETTRDDHIRNDDLTPRRRGNYDLGGTPSHAGRRSESAQYRERTSQFPGSARPRRSGGREPQSRGDRESEERHVSRNPGESEKAPSRRPKPRPRMSAQGHPTPALPESRGTQSQYRRKHQSYDSHSDEEQDDEFETEARSGYKSVGKGVEQEDDDVDDYDD